MAALKPLPVRLILYTCGAGVLVLTIIGLISGYALLFVLWALVLFVIARAIGIFYRNWTIRMGLSAQTAAIASVITCFVVILIPELEYDDSLQFLVSILCVISAATAGLTHKDSAHRPSWYGRSNLCWKCGLPTGGWRGVGRSSQAENPLYIATIQDSERKHPPLAHVAICETCMHGAKEIEH